MKGKHPWNYALTKETDFRLKHRSEEMTGTSRPDLSILAKKRWSDSEFKKMMSEIFSKSEKNQKALNKLMLQYRSPEVQKKAYLKISNTLKQKWLDEDFALDQVSKHSFKPNKKEIFLNAFLQDKFFNVYRYVGDGSFWIGHPPMNPDYLGNRGNNKVIELFGEHWHEPEDEQKRIEAFKKLGYDCLVIWTAELKDEKRLFDKINEFTFK